MQVIWDAVASFQECILQLLLKLFPGKLFTKSAFANLTRHFPNFLVDCWSL